MRHFSLRSALIEPRSDPQKVVFACRHCIGKTTPDATPRRPAEHSHLSDVNNYGLDLSAFGLQRLVGGFGASGLVQVAAQLCRLGILVKRPGQEHILQNITWNFLRNVKEFQAEYCEKMLILTNFSDESQVRANKQYLKTAAKVRSSRLAVGLRGSSRDMANCVLRIFMNFPIFAKCGGCFLKKTGVRICEVGQRE